MHPLDHIVWSALTSAHSHFAEGGALAKRYPADVAPFVAVAEPTASAWAELATLLVPGQPVATFTAAVLEPPFQILERVPCEQMVATQIQPPSDPSQLSRLGSADIPDMLALVELTHPGPFAARTIEMGAYWGIRRDGKLIAMTGERMHPAGYTEVSAVCVDPTYQRQGLAAELVQHVAHGVLARGELPMLHVRCSNTSAIALYAKLGFTIRTQTHLALFVA